MFGTNKIIDAQSIPFGELTLMYLRKHDENLETPEDYIEQFVKVREKMREIFRFEWQKAADK